MLALDVCHDDSVRTCVDRVISETGRIDVLVNNAGVGLEGAVEETSLDEIRAVLETNFFGAVRMMRAVLPIMRKRPERSDHQYRLRGGILAHALFGGVLRQQTCSAWILRIAGP